MKILYISKGDHVDYLDDCLSIGLKSLMGGDLVDCNKRHHIYTSYDEHKVSSLYGKGMSVTRAVEDYDTDRSDIVRKIETKFFDLVIYGSVWRCNDYIDIVTNFYDKGHIVFIDGEDELNIHDCSRLSYHYFKRELMSASQYIHPISFAIPDSRIDAAPNIKTRELAICDPRDRSTYIYEDEDGYYNGYKESLFGITMKKAGWDCMRHYEILANGCIPIFLNISKCPPATMTTLPKSLLNDVLLEWEHGDKHIIYEKYISQFSEIVKNITTTELAKYVIDIVK